MTDVISTRTVRLQPWLRTSGVESCFLTQRGGTLILKERGKTILDETLAPVRLIGRPADGTFWTTHAQRLPDGGFALAAARSKIGEKNLHLFDYSGVFRSSFAIGDGVEHMAIDGRGRIWVGYFDEGIFGNDPLSAHGLSRFDQRGTLEYQWDYEKNGTIFDCDAMTIDQHGAAWICPYTDYFVAAVEDSGVRMLLQASPVSIISGLLTGTTHVGLLGGTDFRGVGYVNGTLIRISPDGPRIEELPKVGPDPTDKESIVTIMSLQTGERTEVQVLDEASTPMIFRNRISCRAGEAVCWTSEHIYRFSLDRLLAA